LTRSEGGFAPFEHLFLDVVPGETQEDQTDDEDEKNEYYDIRIFTGVDHYVLIYCVVLLSFSLSYHYETKYSEESIEQSCEEAFALLGGWW